jgi:hypothetical protein
MKHYIGILISMLLSCSYLLCDQEDSKNIQSQFYKIVNDNSQNTYIQKPSNDKSCSTRNQSDFVDCFFTLPIEEQREVFKALTPARRREFLTHINFENYKKFLDAYSEYDWKILYNALTPSEQKHWPKTVKEQLLMVKYIKKRVWSNNFAMDLAVCGAGVAISPVIFIGYYGFVGYKLLNDNKHPFKENCTAWHFKNYIKSTFEL